jgi:hypothetical protein
MRDLAPTERATVVNALRAYEAALEQGPAERPDMGPQ